MKDNERPGQQFKGLSVQELLGVTNEESAMDIEICLIHSFKNHPFKVVDDEKMQDLLDSKGLQVFFHVLFSHRDSFLSLL